MVGTTGLDVEPKQQQYELNDNHRGQSHMQEQDQEVEDCVEVESISIASSQTASSGDIMIGNNSSLASRGTKLHPGESQSPGGNSTASSLSSRSSEGSIGRAGTKGSLTIATGMNVSNSNIMLKANGDPMTEEETLRVRIRTQVEYYFSQQNLQRDTYMLSQMDNDGYIPVATIAEFKQLKKLTEGNLNLIVESITGKIGDRVDESMCSTICELSDDLERIKASWKRPQRTTIILREVKEGTSEDDIKGLLVGTDYKVQSVRSDVGQTWFVTMATEDDAKNALLHLIGKNLNGESVKARLKSETLPVPSPRVWQPSSDAPAFTPQGFYGGYGVPQQQMGYNMMGFPPRGQVPGWNPNRMQYQRKQGYEQQNSEQQQPPPPQQQQHGNNWNESKNNNSRNSPHGTHQRHQRGSHSNNGSQHQHSTQHQHSHSQQQKHSVPNAGSKSNQQPQNQTQQQQPQNQTQQQQPQNQTQQQQQSPLQNKSSTRSNTKQQADNHGSNTRTGAGQHKNVVHQRDHQNGAGANRGTNPSRNRQHNQTAPKATTGTSTTGPSKHAPVVRKKGNNNNNKPTSTFVNSKKIKTPVFKPMDFPSLPMGKLSLDDADVETTENATPTITKPKVAPMKPSIEYANIVASTASPPATTSTPPESKNKPAPKAEKNEEVGKTKSVPAAPKATATIPTPTPKPPVIAKSAENSWAGLVAKAAQMPPPPQPTSSVSATASASKSSQASKDAPKIGTKAMKSPRHQQSKANQTAAGSSQGNKPIAQVSSSTSHPPLVATVESTPAPTPVPRPKRGWEKPGLAPVTKLETRISNSETKPATGKPTTKLLDSSKTKVQQLPAKKVEVESKIEVAAPINQPGEQKPENESLDQTTLKTAFSAWGQKKSFVDVIKTGGEMTVAAGTSPATAVTSPKSQAKPEQGMNVNNGSMKKHERAPLGLFGPKKGGVGAPGDVKPRLSNIDGNWRQSAKKDTSKINGTR